MQQCTHHVYIKVPLQKLNEPIKKNNILYPKPSLEDPRPKIKNLQPSYNEHKLANGDEIIAVKTGTRSVK